MTPAARLQAILDLLEQIEAEPRPADALVSTYFRARRYIGSKDRAAVSSTLYATLRHRARIDWWLTRVKTAVTPRARLIAYLALIEQKPAGVIDELFSGGKFAPAQLSPEEGKWLARLAGHTIDHPDMPDAVQGECPDWAAEGLSARFGKQFLKEMQAMQTEAPLDLRVNSLKAERAEIVSALKDMGLPAHACRLSPWGVRVKARPNLSAMPMLKNGSVEIQDEGSQLVALLVDAKPGERIVDFCAGAGGKTLAMAASMKNKGRIIACDVLAGRLKRSTERFRRAGVHNIEVRALSSEHDPWVKRHKGGFDRVLVDAPCSGTGTWRRNPDARWKHLGPGLQDLLVLQGRILASASRLVRPGGRLVYATCSLLPEENEKQIDAFLKTAPDFALLPCETVAGFLSPAAAGGMLSLTPARHDTDGFFAAVLERKGQEKSPSTEDADMVK
ncbi:MAG: RsmB/NOP family class I SAM-dependent RNA methyltransferase [Alphaproteobacteria bacterium]|nr:RsmB/NOP family class I SAM-dependent RNA methyltransferase [Alphaproteobacteria bacterium]MBV8548468.1 RsmB/NOP family class I SAM-dependent RNA methyltransferase [Alphaproteobacteria bacterium]